MHLFVKVYFVHLKENFVGLSICACNFRFDGDNQRPIGRKGKR
jgi:hypothetical protein